jgi:hypothetical protein
MDLIEAKSPLELRACLSLALPVSSAGDSSVAPVPRSKDDAGEEPVPKTTAAEFAWWYAMSEKLVCKTIRRRCRVTS